MKDKIIQDISTDLADGYDMVEQGNKQGKIKFFGMLLLVVAAVSFVAGAQITYDVYRESVRELIGGK